MDRKREGRGGEHRERKVGEKTDGGGEVLGVTAER